MMSIISVTRWLAASFMVTCSIIPVAFSKELVMIDSSEDETPSITAPLEAILDVVPSDQLPAVGNWTSTKEEPTFFFNDTRSGYYPKMEGLSLEAVYPSSSFSSTHFSSRLIPLVQLERKVLLL